MIYPRLNSDTKKSLISVPQLPTMKWLGAYLDFPPYPHLSPYSGDAKASEGYLGGLQRPFQGKGEETHPSGVVQAPICETVEE